MSKRKLFVMWKIAAAIIGVVAGPIIVYTGVAEFTNTNPRVFSGLLAIAYGLAGIAACVATVFYVPMPEEH